MPIFIILGIFSYLEFSLFGNFLNDFSIFITGTLFLIFLFLAVLWFGVIFAQSKEDSVILLEKPLLTLAFYSMGLMSFLFSLTLVRDLIGLLIFSAHLMKPTFNYSIYDHRFTYLIIGLSLLLFLIGSLSAKLNLVTKRIEVPIPGLSSEFQDFKIVQLSDVHLGTGVTLDHFKTIMKRVNALAPDLLVLTGDIIDGNTKDIQAELECLRLLDIPSGKFYVLGNHEYYWNAKDSIEAVKNTGVTVLLNENKLITKNGAALMIAGVTDPAASRFQLEEPNVTKAASTGALVHSPAENSIPKILLCHQPVLAEKAAAAGFDLMLSGHTHGGQFIPWSWLIHFAHQYHTGLSRVNEKMWIYVSHGTGYWGPPIRLGTECEITEIILQSS